MEKDKYYNEDDSRYFVPDDFPISRYTYHKDDYMRKIDSGHHNMYIFTFSAKGFGVDEAF